MDRYRGIMKMDEEFFRKVYEQVARIPRGRVCTYGGIAELAGYYGAYREVGIAMSKAGGRDLPCHRVVNKKGTLAPSFAFGSQEVQRGMLEAEGVGFHDDGTIDMERFIWPGEREEQLGFDI